MRIENDSCGRLYYLGYSPPAMQKNQPTANSIILADDENQQQRTTLLQTMDRSIR
jgi:hypothetical protein